MTWARLTGDQQISINISVFHLSEYVPPKHQIFVKSPSQPTLRESQASLCKKDLLRQRPIEGLPKFPGYLGIQIFAKKSVLILLPRSLGPDPQLSIQMRKTISKYTYHSYTTLKNSTLIAIASHVPNQFVQVSSMLL